MMCNLTIIIIVLTTIGHISESRSATRGIHSDVIVTKWPSIKTDGESLKLEENQPGWMRKQLMKFGEVASKIGNAMGTHATKISMAIDKVCEVIKTVIPLLAAVCHVGQFKFCAAANDAPPQLYDALTPNMLNLNDLDR